MKIRPGIHCKGDSVHANSYLLDVCVKCTEQTCLKHDLKLAVVVTCGTLPHSSL